MKVEITIECETINELKTHLSVIRTAINLEAKHTKLNNDRDEFPEILSLEDNNCYGSHTVIIYPFGEDPEYCPECLNLVSEGHRKDCSEKLK